MRFSILSCLTAGLGLVSATEHSTDPQDALAFAYMYGFPLYAYGDVVKPIFKLGANIIPNYILHNPDPTEPNVIGVVRPNADTLYSILFIDLSSTDLVVSVPEVPGDRYWVFPLCTPYGDDLVNLGSIANSSPGDYLITFDPDGYGIETENVPDGYAGVIRFPMPYGLSNLRILTDRTEEDVQAVRNIQNGFKLKLKPRRGSPIAPPLNLSMFADPAYNPSESLTAYEAVMKVAAALTPYTKPYVKEDRAWVAEKLYRAGFRDGDFVQPDGTDIEAAIAQANKTARAYLARPEVTTDVGNEWYLINEDYIGAFDSQYEMRYHIGLVGYLALIPEECVYPWRDVEFTLEEGQSILLTFPEKPRVSDNGFWSLTVYGPDQGLIENDLNRYSLGDRDNLTFPDGTLVEEGDGTAFNILIQATDIEPPSNWTSNWLPIPPGGASVSITLRWYGADEYMINGSYIHPSVATVDALRA